MTIEDVCKALVDKGKIVEAGWLGYKHLCVPANAGAVQVEDTRRAFYAGAMHLFSSMMTALEEGEEATAEDLRRIDCIAEELKAFEPTLVREGRGTN